MNSFRSAIDVLRRDLGGASLVEFTVIMPVLFMLTLGTVDLGYLLYDYGSVNKAVYAGAHRAIVSDPVSDAVTSLTWDPTKIGNDCSSSTGVSTDCTVYADTITCSKPGATGSCSSGAFNPTAFGDIVGKMQTTLGCAAGSSTCLIQPANVSISYARTGTLGFVGQPNGLPVNVTVGVNCLYHQFFFVGGLLNLTFQAPQGCGTATGWVIPAYATTLTSEDLATN